MPERLGSLRVLFALEGLGDQLFDTPPFSVACDTSYDPAQQARLWYFSDFQVDGEALYDRKPPWRVERRREDLATAFAAARARRASYLADLGWCPKELVPPSMADVRRQYHWLRSAVAAYDACCQEQATALRRFAKRITQPAPAPRPRKPEPPRPPYSGVHPSALEARLLDVFRVRCTSVGTGPGTVTARWLPEVSPDRLRTELGFILAPAVVSDATPQSVTLTWSLPETGER
jgi:hypothetical protein